MLMIKVSTFDYSEDVESLLQEGIVGGLLLAQNDTASSPMDIANYINWCQNVLAHGIDRVVKGHYYNVTPHKTPDKPASSDGTSGGRRSSRQHDPRLVAELDPALVAELEEAEFEEEALALSMAASSAQASRQRGSAALGSIDRLLLRTEPLAQQDIDLAAAAAVSSASHPPSSGGSGGSPPTSPGFPTPGAGSSSSSSRHGVGGGLPAGEEGTGAEEHHLPDDLAGHMVGELTLRRPALLMAADQVCDYSPDTTINRITPPHASSSASPSYQEGDIMNTYPGVLSPWTNMMSLGATGNTRLAREYGAGVAGEMAGVGFNVVFGPVIDCNTNPRNPVIHTRSFGEDPATVAKLGIQVCNALWDGRRWLRVLLLPLLD
jgi:hypothetical protein